MGGLAWVCPGEVGTLGPDTGMKGRGHWTRSDCVPHLLPSLVSSLEDEEEEEKKEEKEMLVEVKENEEE